jgi:hypothetical protein
MEVSSALRSPCSAIRRAPSSSRFTMGRLASIGVRVEQREGPFLRRHQGRGAIGGAAITAIQSPSAPPPPPSRSAGRPWQRIRQPRHAQPDAPLGMGLPRLRLQREARWRRRRCPSCGPPWRRDRPARPRPAVRPGKRFRHQPREVDRAQQAGAIGRQRLLAAGIGGRDGLAIARLFSALIRSMKITPGSA